MKIPYYPSRESRLRRLLDIFEPESGAKIVDLGSGDGRVLRLFADRYDDIYLFGYERDKRLIEVSRRLSREYDRIKIIGADLFKADLSRYDIVYTYLTRDALNRLRDKAVEFLGNGGIWIALDYPIPGIKPAIVIELDRWHRYFIYGYDNNRVRKMFRI
ncbi:TPA: hypothetical protein EYP83_03975 [Candidatus Geothermarchaeota archaeon]|nr:hypothetical protein [Candidatus Geothermarchaeota archaeon]HIQ12769.1 hypothetical protein [Thermoprotei archaeon]